ncbi:MAG: T9SS type A sorting domain-containing protein [Bacteroidia bacterium]|nr:T9SS type A sorting domain-containing protein [Bacteroidia bacterium]MCF8425241.1 T9SS type A sorting domain-containing protein [Bacteroidia bacterium]
MKKIAQIILFVASGFALNAQTNSGFTYSTVNQTTAKAATINLMELPNLPDAHIINIKAAPAPLNASQAKKLSLDQQRATFKRGPILNKKAGAAAPTVTKSFNGNVTQSTPNDNDFCIGNSGRMISCVNTNINVFNDSGVQIIGKTLASLGQELGPLNRTYDPRTIYDPVADRYIVVYLQGSSSLDTRIIIAFSTSGDPSKTWNLYQLPGNITGDSSWSDYPIISLSKDELFITVNRLKDNTFWKNGFLESYIWQVDKNKGFAGDSLPQKIYNNIQFNGKSVWSICPVKGGSQLYGPEMYFLSHRPSDLTNDTVFVHYITNTIASGNAELGMRVLKNPVSYGLQPNALMPNGKKLQTNDARVLSAMYEGGVIYYVGNTIDPQRFSPGVYFGRIHEIWTSTPRLEGTIIASDTLDFGYPSIAYVGSGENGDHSSMITFSHVSDKQFPGTSVVYVDRNFNISEPVFVKKGEGNIQLIGDTVERWGDYTGIQRKYNELGVAWLSGSWGTAQGQNRTWIGRVQTNDLTSGLNQTNETISTGKVYPNPSSEQVTFEFEMKTKKLLGVELRSIDGKTTQLLVKDWAKPGLNQVRLDISTLNSGMYFVNLLSDEGIEHTFKFVVQH